MKSNRKKVFKGAVCIVALAVILVACCSLPAWASGASLVTEGCHYVGVFLYRVFVVLSGLITLSCMGSKGDR